MFCGRDLSLQDGGSRVVGFDMGPQLASGETVTSVASSLILEDGLDNALSLNPLARFNGTPFVNGTEILQGVTLIGGPTPLVGNVYVFTIVATTSLGQVIPCWTKIRMEFALGPQPLMAPGQPSASAQTYALPMPSAKFTLPIFSGYAGEDYPPADPGETRLYTFDLSPALSPNETIKPATVSVISLRGGDQAVQKNPQAYCVGATMISGAAVTQLIAWPSTLPDISGNLYGLAVGALTNFAQMPSGWSRVTIAIK